MFIKSNNRLIRNKESTFFRFSFLLRFSFSKKLLGNFKLGTLLIDFLLYLKQSI